MVLLSSPLLLTTYSLTLLLTSYFLLTNPSTILNASPIWILGESMHIRPLLLFSTSTPTKLLGTTNTPSPVSSELLALLSLILASQALLQSFLSGDLSNTVSSGGAKGEQLYALRKAQNRWMTLAGARVLLAGALVAWIYIGSLANRGVEFGMGILEGGGKEGFMGLLANRVVFTAALADMLFWGYLWTVIREEGREVWKGIEERRERDE